MKEETKFILVLVFLCLMGFILSIPYFFPPLSILECKEIEYSNEKVDCFNAVSSISHTDKYCADMRKKTPYYNVEDCKEMVKKTKGITSWDMKVSTNNFSDFKNSEYWYELELRCAIDGLNELSIQYKKDYFDYYYPIFKYYEYSFDDFCLQALERANESICSKVIDEKANCERNFRLARGVPLSDACPNSSEICHEQYSSLNDDIEACISNECYMAYAIKNNDPSVCNRMSQVDSDTYDSCWMFMGINNLQIEYCEEAIEEENRHYCRAVILAEEGS